MSSGDYSFCQPIYTIYSLQIHWRKSLLSTALSYLWKEVMFHLTVLHFFRILFLSLLWEFTSWEISSGWQCIALSLSISASESIQWLIYSAFSHSFSLWNSLIFLEFKNNLTKDLQSNGYTENMLFALILLKGSDISMNLP